MTNIEDKTNVIGKVPSKLNGNCPVCKEETTFNYRGYITSIKNQEPPQIYNCRKCEGTFVLNSLTEKYDAKFELNDLINAHPPRLSLIDSLKKRLIKIIYSI